MHFLDLHQFSDGILQRVMRALRHLQTKLLRHARRVVGRPRSRTFVAQRGSSSALGDAAGFDALKIARYVGVALSESDVYWRFGLLSFVALVGRGSQHSESNGAPIYRTALTQLIITVI
jgi:hypothetical protein